MSYYKIGTSRRWADGTGYYHLSVPNSPLDRYQGLAQCFSGRGHSVDGIYYVYWDVVIPAQYLKFSLHTSDVNGKPGAILASSGNITYGTEDAFCFIDINETFLDNNSKYFVSVKCMGDWGGLKGGYGYMAFCGQPPVEGILHYSSAGRGYAIVDPNYEGWWQPSGIFSEWTIAGRDWPFLLRRVGSQVDGHMGLGYPDEELCSDTPRMNPVFKAWQNYTLTGIGFGLRYAGVPSAPLYAEFFDGRDCTAASSSMGTMMVAENSQGLSDDGWLTTVIPSANIHFLENHYYTIKFYSADTTKYNYRIGGASHVANGQLSTTLTYDSGFAYIWDNYIEQRNPTYDFPYYLECDDYIPPLIDINNIIMRIQDIKTIIGNIIFENRSVVNITGIGNIIFENRSVVNITGHVYDYRNDANYPFYNCVIDFYRYGDLYKSIDIDGNGNYSATALGAITIKPRKYDWDFVPQYITDDLYDDLTANFYASSESKWWHSDSSTGKGNLFAFRQLITFPTPHPQLTAEDTIRLPFQTGYMERVSTAAYFNDSIQHSMGQGILYIDGKTHVVYLSTATNVRGATKNHLTGEWTEYWIAPTLNPDALYDTHYYPNLVADNNKYIYIIQGSHGIHNLKIFKSNNPNDMSSFDSGIDIPNTSNNTYPRARSINNLIYIVYRAWDNGAHLNFVIRDIDGNNYGPYTIAYYNDNDLGGIPDKSIYICGFQIDNDGVIHVAYNYFDGYGSWNKGRAIGYAYSPPNINGIATAGMYWFNGAGHTCGVSTGYGYLDTNNCIRWMNDGFTHSAMGQIEMRFNSFIIYSWDSSQSYTNAPYYYHGNTEAMFIHPTETITNDTHTIKRAFFTWHAFPNHGGYTDINYEVQGFLGFYDSTDPARFLNGTNQNWVVHTITATANNIDGIGQLAWKGRNWGGIAIDNVPAIHVYGFIKPSDHTVWFGSELTEWISYNNGATWRTRYLTKKSGFGISAPSVKADFSNNSIELVYGRGYDIIYYSEPFYGKHKIWDRIRLDGEDIRIVYASASSNAIEIPRIANFFNYASTLIYFSPQHTIPSTEIYDSAYGNYYIYYGRNETANPIDMF